MVGEIDRMKPLKYDFVSLKQSHKKLSNMKADWTEQCFLTIERPSPSLVIGK